MVEEATVCFLVDTTEGKPYIENYIRHINDMTCWKIQGKETFEEHLDRLISYFEKNKRLVKATAVKNFKNFQREEDLKLVLEECFEGDTSNLYNNFDFSKEGV